MLNQLLTIIIGMSLTASCVIVAVLIINSLLRWIKAPAFIRCALWLAVLFRLLCPVAPSADISLFNWEIWQQPAAVAEISTQVIPQITTGNIGAPSNSAAMVAPQPQPQPQAPATSPLALLWLVGLTLLLGYHTVSYLRLKKSIITATLVKRNIYRSEKLSASFVCGIIRPRVYLPANLDEKTHIYILAHEQAHIRRLDHLLKPLWLFACCVHWFNPLVWLAFSRMCAEMEQSCDEAALRRLGNAAKANYCSCLLALAGSQPAWGALPGFGQRQIKGRVKNILGYKKPAMGMVLLSALVVTGTACALTTNAPPPETHQPKLQLETPQQRTDAELEAFVQERIAAYREIGADSTFNERGAISNSPEFPYTMPQEYISIELDKQLEELQSLLLQMEDDALAAAKAEELIREILEQRANKIYYSLAQPLLAWPYYGAIGELFGVRQLGFHSGVDMLGPIGDAVTAAAAGEVVLADWYYGYGNCVIIDHGAGFETYYAHLSAFGVSLGDTVESGQVIGYIGSTGRANEPQLHFEVRLDGDPQDPLTYLTQTQTEDI